jgi:hypothetical protein
MPLGAVRNDHVSKSGHRRPSVETPSETECQEQTKHMTTTRLRIVLAVLPFQASRSRRQDNKQKEKENTHILVSRGVPYEILHDVLSRACTDPSALSGSRQRQLRTPALPRVVTILLSLALPAHLALTISSSAWRDDGRCRHRIRHVLNRHSLWRTLAHR